MIKPKLELKPGKVYTYRGTEGVYSVVAGEVLEGDAAPTMLYGTGAPGSGLGKKGDVYIDNTNMVLYTRGETNWDTGRSFKGIDGRNGVNGINGTNGAPGADGNHGLDGQSPISGYLTNEVVAIASSDDGSDVDANDLTGARGFFIVTEGLNRLYGSGEINFTIVGGTSLGDGSSRKTDNGLRLTLFSATGEYVLDVDPFIGVWSPESLIVNFTLIGTTTSGHVIEKVFTVTKAKGGKDAKILTLTSDKYNFNFDANGQCWPGIQEISLHARLKNLPGPVTWKVSWLDVSGTAYNLLNADFSNYLSTSGANNESAVFTNEHYAWVRTKHTTATSVRIKAYVTTDAEYFDEITIGHLEGAPGGLSGVLSNESHILVSDVLGVVEDFSTAFGKFDVWAGALKLTNSDAVDFSASSDGETYDETATSGGLAVEIDNNGNYNVVVDDLETFMSQFNPIVFYLRATHESTNYIDKTFTLVKSFPGENGEPARFVGLTTTKYNFSKKSDGTFVVSTATFNVQIDNISGPDLTWEVSRVAGDPLIISDISNYLVIANNKKSAQMTHSQFSALLGNGTGVKVKITENSSSFTDTIEIVPVADGAAGTPALSGYLSNESQSITAYSYADGKISDDLDMAGGIFKVLEGFTEVTTDANTSFNFDLSAGETAGTFTDGANGSGKSLSRGLTNGQGLKLKLYTAGNYKGRYVLEEDAANSWKTDGVVFNLKATRGTTSIIKTYSINKSKSSSILNIRPTTLSFNIKSDGTAQNSGDKITFKAFKDSLKKVTPDTVTWEVWGVKSDGTLSSAALTLATYLTVKSNPADKSEAEMTVAQFKAIRDLSVTPKYIGCQIKATYDGVSDVVTVNAILDGEKGNTGNDSVAGYLTNESFSVNCVSNGKIIEDILVSGASGGRIIGSDGSFKIQQGSTDITANCDFEIVDDISGDPAITTPSGESNAREFTKNNLTFRLYIADSGSYKKGDYYLRVSSNSAWNTDSATFTVKATGPASIGSPTVTKIYSVSKTKSNATVALTATSYAFALNNAGAAKNAGDTVKLTANITLLKEAKKSGEVTWEVWGVNASGTETKISTTANLLTYLTVNATPSDKSTANIPVEKFRSALAATGGPYKGVNYKATFDGVTDEVTIYYTNDGEKGEKGDTGIGVGSYVNLGYGRIGDTPDRLISTNDSPLFFGEVQNISHLYRSIGTNVALQNGAGTHEGPNQDKFGYIIGTGLPNNGLIQAYHDRTEFSNIFITSGYAGSTYVFPVAGYYRFNFDFSLYLTNNSTATGVSTINLKFVKWSNAAQLKDPGQTIGLVQKSFLLLPKPGAAYTTFEQMIGSRTFSFSQNDLVRLYISTKNSTLIQGPGGVNLSNVINYMFAASNNLEAGGDSSITITKVEKPSAVT